MKSLAIILLGLVIVCCGTSLLLANDVSDNRQTSWTKQLVTPHPPPRFQHVTSREIIPSRPIETILLVDDDGGADNGGIYQNVLSYYTDALNEAGYSYTLFRVGWTIYPAPPLNGPTYDTMIEYDLVIWFTGETWGGGVPGRNDVLTAVDVYNLSQYLDDGGKLFLNSQDYLWDSFASAGSFHSGQFPYDYLGVSSVLQDVFSPPATVEGATGSFAQGLDYTVANPYPTATIWADSLEPRGQKLLNVDGTPDACAVQFDGGDFYTVFSTCGVEGLVNGTHRVADYLEAIFEGLTPVGPIPTPTIITEYRLEQNFPNPFNPSTEIRYQLPVQGNVTLTVYNVTGQEVAKLIHGEQTPGIYHVRWNAANQPSGMYFYKLAVNGYQDIRRMMLLK